MKLPVHAIDGDYIREWLVLGPFLPNDLEIDFLADVGGEANIQPQEGDTVITQDGEELTWKRYQTKGNIINLSQAVDYSKGTTTTIYAACSLQSQTPGDAQVIMGSSRNAVWINGQRVYPDDDYILREDADHILLEQYRFEVELKAGTNRCLVKICHTHQGRIGFAMRVVMLPQTRAVISGVITDETGAIIPDASVRLEQENLEIAQTETDTSGNYQMNVYPVHGKYALSAVSGTSGDWQMGIQMQEGERRKMNLQLKPAVSISGSLVTLNEAAPLTAVPVEAVIPSFVASHANDDADDTSVANDEPQVVATALSNERGQYQFTNLKPGKYQLRCQIPDGYAYYGENETYLQIERGKTLTNIDFRLPPFKKGTWQTYGPLDGLGGNYITCIHGTPDGMTWFGTWGGGVSRFDGKQFVTFTTKDGLPDNRVTAIYNTPDGVMWFGTQSGISRYDGKRFIAFTKQELGLLSNRVAAIYGAPDGMMWFGTVAGVACYDGKPSATFTDEDGLAHYFVSTIHGTPDGMMWFGTLGGGVTRYDGKQLVTFTQNSGEFGYDGLAGNWICAACVSADGVIWFGTEHDGVSRYDGEQFVTLSTKEGLANNGVHAIYQDNDGVMWFGTGGQQENGGVSCYDGKQFINLTTRDGLADNWVTSIYQDANGVMWFGTRYGGVSRYDGKSVVNFITEDGLAGNRVKTIYRAHDGAIWFGTLRNGVSRYDGKLFINFTRIPANSATGGLPHNEVNAIHSSPDGIIWFGTRGGVSRYDGERFTTITTQDGLPNNEINAIYHTPDGVTWFGTHGGGVSRYDGKAFVNFTLKDGLAHNRVYDIYRDTDGVIWFGTHGGVSQYNGKTFVNFTQKDGLAEDWVTAIYQDKDGMMWFGTAEGGVSRYDGKEFANFTKEDGLSDYWITDIYQDTDGVMLFGTLGGGVSQYDGVAWTALDTRDGLASNTVHSICQDSDGFDTPSVGFDTLRTQPKPQPKGFLWFGTEGGITRYRRNRVPPINCIVSITTDRRYVDLNELGPAIVGTRITFEYDSIDFKTHPQKRLYRYKLEGYDADWNMPTRETQVDYAELPVGKYTFHVQAIDRDLNYSEPATVRVTVELDPRDFTIAALQTELGHLRQEVGRKYYFENIIGRSAPIKQVYALMEKAIDSGLTVFISGETGTGKELVAKAIHYNSLRQNRPLLELNCGGVPKDLVASTLFGHRKGAFTGADKDSIGLFETAEGGSVLLDEIGEMPNEAQVHLLRVLQERKIQRVGETRLRDVDVRVIAITNRDLEADVRAERFRQDLYYRLNVFPIHVPALRDRSDDIPLLVEHFLQKACQKLGKEIDGFASGVFDMLQSYNWPGNIRELENEIDRAAAFVEEGLKIRTYHFSSKLTQGESLIQDVLSEQVSYTESVDRFRRRLVEEVLRECGGNRHQAANMLGMDRSNLIALIRRLGIEKID